MDTPKNKAGELTEKIMVMFSPFHNPILKVDTGQYNRIYEEVYRILSKEEKNEKIKLIEIQRFTGQKAKPK